MDIKPTKTTTSKTGPTTTEPTTFEKATTTTEGSRRRTDSLFHAIDELKDNRSFAHKMFGFFIQDLDAKALSENFADVKKYFKQYEQFNIGITIPEDILRNFEPIEGKPFLGSPAYITEAQANQLKKLAAEGENLLQKKLDQREVSYGPFQAKEIVSNVLQEGDLTPQEIQNFLSISTSFKKLAKPRLFLTSSDLSKPDLSEKLQFAREKNLKLNLKLESDADIDTMMAFMENPDNIDLLKNLEAFQLPVVNHTNIYQVKKLLSLMATHCPNWTSFSCGRIVSGLTLTLSALNNLTSFSCGDIYSGATLTLSKLNNLTSFSCGNIDHTATLTLPEEFPQLQHIVFGEIENPAAKAALEDLKTKVQSKQ